jgi:hypothetical protein
MEELIQLQNMFSQDELVILSVDTDLQETLEDVFSFKANFPTAQWTFAVSNSEFNGYFPASSIPTMYILDQDQKVARTEVGVTSASSLQETINSLL